MSGVYFFSHQSCCLKTSPGTREEARISDQDATQSLLAFVCGFRCDFGHRLTLDMGFGLNAAFGRLVLVDCVS